MFTVIDHAYHREKAVEGQSFEVNLISGEMYWRTLTQSFPPLGVDQSTIKRERPQRHLRAARADRTIWRQEPRLLEALPLTHDVRHQGRQTLHNRACHVLELKPRRSPSGDAGFRQHAQMRLHIDQEEFPWVRAEFVFPQAAGFHIR